MQQRTLGNTGETVSAIGLGGWHLGLSHVSEKLAIQLVQSAIDRGITFMDNCWDYNEGLSEIRMGKALREGSRRQKVFLMTKIDGRSKKEAMRQLEHSLERLQTDCIDLVQHHEVLRFEDPNRIFDPEGANAALIEARQQGKLRFIGFTGHKDPRVHLYMLDVAQENGFHFDTAQMPVNLMDAHFRSFSNLVVPECVKQGVAVLAMKTMGNGHILKSNTVTPIECLQYALHLPVSVVITGIDSMEILDQAFKAADTYKPFSDHEWNALLAKTKSAATKGQFELFKTSSVYDGTALNPSWLGSEPERVQAAVSA